MVNNVRHVFGCSDPVVRGTAVYLPMVIGNERVILAGTREMMLSVAATIQKIVGKKAVRAATIAEYERAFAKWDRDNESRRSLCERHGINFRGFCAWVAIKDAREVEDACNPKVICLLSRSDKAA